MFPSLVLAFTAVFTVTALHSLVRLVVRAPAGDRTAELSNLLMSIAMVGMTWGWPGPDTAAGLAQLVVFGVLAVVFVVRLVDPAEHRPVGSAHHLLMLGAMVWMLLGTPASHGHHGHGAAPALTQLVTVAFAVLLCATVLAHVARMIGPRLDLAGHVLMSGGMAAMLVAMS